jgi:ankyrin repeat protein
LKLLMDAHADINVKNKKGRTPLMSITSMLWWDDVSLPEAMIGYGADVNARDNYGENLLMTNSSPTPDYVRFMLRYHVDPNIHDKLGFTPLSLMALDASDKPDVFRALLDAKVDVNARNTSGATALMDCALSCSLEVIQTLVDAGADKCIRSENFTALEMAIKYERPSDIQAAFSSPNCPARPHMVLGNL